jgi:hypothetical protein
LKDRVVKWKLDVLNLVETHDQNPTAPGPLQGWHKTISTPVGGKHGMATLSAMPQSKSYKDTNVAAMALTWEKQEIWVITVYFPNDLN